jgi:hypothetical protein
MASVRLICAANFGLFYIGGGTWLLCKSANRPERLIALAFTLCCCLNMFGPLVLVIAGGILDSGIRSNPLDEVGVSPAQLDAD